MRVLLSTIGSRGDVQPLVALALRLERSGHQVRLCVPPDFREWIEGLGLHVTPIGPEVRTANRSSGGQQPSPEQRRQFLEAWVTSQFETISAAAAGCDLLVGATALQIAARSVAERLGIPYVFVAYCPAVLPSPDHAPPPLTTLGQTPPAAGAKDARELWARDARRFNDSFGEALGRLRASAGLPRVDDVRDHIFTERPWLAADPALGPWPDPADSAVLQTGAWILNDERSLASDLEAFLDAGEPPIYFGFGSMHAPQDMGTTMIESARSLGRRAIVSRGWADFADVDGADDCITIDEVNQQALFGRVAAVVHHGGAGTTTVAGLAGAPQVVVPQLYDQHYWAGRIAELGIGTAHAAGVSPTAESLASALESTLRPEVAGRARSVAASMSRDGADVAVERLLETDGISLSPADRTH